MNYRQVVTALRKEYDIYDFLSEQSFVREMITRFTQFKEKVPESEWTMGEKLKINVYLPILLNGE